MSIDWYAETVGGQEVAPPLPEPSQSGVDWYQETVANTTPEQTIATSAQISPPQLTTETSIPEAQAGQNFAERTNERLQGRNTQFLQAIIDAASGDISLGEGNLRMAGNVAGAYFDTLGEGFKSVGSGVAAITPDTLKEITGKAIEASKEAFLATDMGQAGLQAALTGIDTYKTWKEANPRAASNLEASANIALILAPPNIAGAKPTRLSRVGESIRKGTQQKKEAWVKDLVLPEQTKAVRTAETGRTVVSPITSKKSVVPTKWEADMIKEVSKVPDISKPGIRKTIQEVKNKTNAHLEKITNDFERSLAKTGAVADQIDITNRVKGAIDTAQREGIFIVGEGKAVAKKLKRAAESIINEHSKGGEITGSGILQARRGIDALIRKQQKNVWNPNTADTAAKQLAKKTRDTMNDLLESHIQRIDPGIPVKSELKRQSLLISAGENMAPKAAIEANDMLGRTWQHVARITKLRSETANMLAVLTGTTVLNALTQYSSAISTGLGVVAVGTIAGKLALSQTSRKAISGMVSAIDEALEASVKAGNKLMIQQLRADRAAVIELLQNTSVVDDDEFKGITIPITEALGEQ